jgi:hypothetical protein
MTPRIGGGAAFVMARACSAGGAEDTVGVDLDVAIFV